MAEQPFLFFPVHSQNNDYRFNSINNHVKKMFKMDYWIGMAMTSLWVQKEHFVQWFYCHKVPPMTSNSTIPYATSEIAVSRERPGMFNKVLGNSAAPLVCTGESGI